MGLLSSPSSTFTFVERKFDRRRNRRGHCGSGGSGRRTISLEDRVGVGWSLLIVVGTKLVIVRRITCAISPDTALAHQRPIRPSSRSSSPLHKFGEEASSTGALEAQVSSDKGARARRRMQISIGRRNRRRRRPARPVAVPLALGAGQREGPRDRARSRDATQWDYAQSIGTMRDRPVRARSYRAWSSRVVAPRRRDNTRRAPPRPHLRCGRERSRFCITRMERRSESTRTRPPPARALTVLLAAPRCRSARRHPAARARLVYRNCFFR